jgi:hypothetical protein
VVNGTSSFDIFTQTLIVEPGEGVTKISSGEGDKRQFSRRKICEGNIFRK